MPRTIAGKAARRSAPLGIRLRIDWLTTRTIAGRSRLAMISPSPNMPIATGTKSSPSEISAIPKVIRGAPELTSMPTRPSSTPSSTIAKRLGDGAVGEHDGRDQAEHEQAEIFDRR